MTKNRKNKQEKGGVGDWMAKKLNTAKITKAILSQIESGSSDYKIYSTLKVSCSTFNIWKSEHIDDYNQAKEQYRLNALSDVELHLNKKIHGGWRIKQRYEVDEDGNEMLVGYERQQVDPELNAIMFYLKSTNPERWNPTEYARLQQEQKQDDSLLDIVQELSKFDVKNYDNRETFETPKDFDDEVQE